jgi:tetratricopeptide (TPR) repeat protein
MRPQLDTIATLLDQGAADSAIRMLRSSWEPELPAEERIPLYCMWIRGLCEIGDIEHAVTLSRRAAGEYPSDPDILTALGNVLDIAGKLEEAREAFELAVALDGTSVLQRYNLGAVVERLGDEETAEKCYREAVSMDQGSPTMVEASGALGALLRRRGRLVEAEEIYDAYLEEDPLEVEMLVEHGICLSDLNRLDDAISRFELAISLESDHPSAWYNLAITLFRQGRYEEAHESMSMAHRADPRNPLALAVLGAWSLADKDADLDNALSLLYGAIDLIRQLREETELGNGYASLVVEEVFEALWQNERRDEAREIARVAGRNNWITPHILDTLNRSDYGELESTSAFKVTARAQLELERPDDWPHDAGGYTTDLTVIATNEDEAREFTLSYLRELEPNDRIQFDVRVVGRGSALQEQEGTRRAPGVARVDGYRAYFREDFHR